MTKSQNLDIDTVKGFGKEWSAFDQRLLSSAEQTDIFNRYFSIFPWNSLPINAVGFDLGCGSGRWAACVSLRVGKLHCIDASPEALEVAKANLENYSNCSFHSASVDQIPLEPGTMDFGYSLGVLHHIPDTLTGLRACVECLKPGAPFLLYLYYSLDNRPWWFRVIWKASDALRKVISRLPHPLKMLASGLLALVIYWPFSRLARLIEMMGRDPKNIPLAFYRRRSFYVMRTDSYDRFCTRLEQRFSRDEIGDLMVAAGLRDIKFRESAPYWCSIGYRRD